MIIFFLILLGGISNGDVRQFWVGTFQQTVPVSWSGPIELYIRYESFADSPQPIDGVLSWPSIGDTKVRIEGKRFPDGSLEFEEKECVEGDCGRFALGGTHHLRFEKRRILLFGQTGGKLGLGKKGKYVLHLRDAP